MSFATRAFAETEAAISDAQRLARDVLADDRFQSELPESGDLDSSFRLLSWFAGFGSLALTVLALVAVALLVLLVVWWFTEARWRWREESDARKGSDRSDALAEAGLVDLEPPERLAAEGRYDDAIHHLLLIAIQRLCRRAATRPDPARTSRELLRLLPLKSEARAGFAGLVQAVELAYFGGVPAGPEDYRLSMAHFRSALGEGSS